MDSANTLGAVRPGQDVGCLDGEIRLVVRANGHDPANFNQEVAQMERDKRELAITKQPRALPARPNRKLSCSFFANSGISIALFKTRLANEAPVLPSVSCLSYIVGGDNQFHIPGLSGAYRRPAAVNYG